MMLGVAILALLPGVATALPSLAASDCGQLVYDRANLLGGDTKQVEVAANNLGADVGADVHVVTLPSIPTSTFDQYKAAFLASCPAWQDGYGQAKENLLIIAVSMNPRQIALYSGRDWTSALSANGEDNRIKAGILKPAFKAALTHPGSAATYFAKGFEQAMAETDSVLTAYEHPKQNQGGTTIINKKPANLTWLWVLIGVALFLLAAGALLFLWLRRRAAEEQRQTARSKALAAKQAVDAKVVGFDPARLAVLQSKATQFGLQGDTEGEKLEQEYTRFREKYQAATSAIATNATSAGDPNRDDLTTGTYEAIQQAYDGILANATAAVEAAEEVDRLCAVVQQKLDGLAVRITTLGEKVAEVRQEVAGMKAAGFFDQSLEPIRVKLGTADEDAAAARAAGETVQALKLVLAAEQLVRDASNLAEKLQKRHDDLAQGVQELESRIAELSANVQTALEAFVRIKASNPEHVWAVVKGNGTEAQNRIAVAGKLKDELVIAGGMQQQDWDKGDQLLAEARKLLNAADALLDAVTDLEVNINKAKARAPEEIRAAENDLVKAQQYETAHDADVDDSHKRELRQAEHILGEARIEAAARQPDWTQVVELALQANQMADSILAQCLGEVEAADRLRRQAATAVQQAEAAIAKARKYIHSHSEYVDSDTKDELRGAESLLARAKSASHAADQLRLATQAKKQANEAREHARDDVDRNTPQDDWSSGYNPYSTTNSLLAGALVGGALSNSGGWGSPVNLGGSGGGGGGGGLGGSSIGF
jgi:uncharacterized membrane protein YgcG